MDPEDLERDRFAIVPTLPNFGRLGGAFGMISLFHDALKVIECWDCAMKAAQPPKFNYAFPPRSQSPICELLRWEGGQNLEET